MREIRKKVKIKYRNIAILLIILLGGVFVLKISFGKSDKIVKINDNFDNLQEIDAKKLCDSQSLTCHFDYVYNSQVSKGLVISSEKNNNEYNIVISNGQVSIDDYKKYKVNELGKVPIMMYHGIVNTLDNKYTGGNVDKAGYNRTAKAFREDLEFYYQNGYRMVRLIDYVNGNIDVPLGMSPIVLTFDDGNKNNFNVLGLDDNGNLIIDPNCAVGILEEFKKKYPDYNVTATFFLMDNLFNQKEYDEKIMHWLVENGYDIGNHTTTHPDFTKISRDKTLEVVGKMYQKLDKILGNKYVKIVALPFGSPYKKTHANYSSIISGTYNGYSYETKALLRVGWESEVSPFDKNFDMQFIKRCRAYDNNGSEFDIQMVFKLLENTRYISDGDINTIVIKESDTNKLSSDITKEIIKY